MKITKMIAADEKRRKKQQPQQQQQQQSQSPQNQSNTNRNQKTTIIGTALAFIVPCSFWIVTLVSLTLHYTLLTAPADAQSFNLGCSPAYCSAYGKCPEFHCHGKHKVTLKNATTCGCCHRCVNEHAEGDACPLNMIGNLPGIQCGPHLRCADINDHGRCVKVDLPCEQERQLFERSSSQLITGSAKPECDQYGQYTTKRCKNGTICQCVNDAGQPIFGIAPYNEAKEMNCLCSRQYELLNEKLREVRSRPIEKINFMRCQANGNYEPYQMHLHYAYCVHAENGTMWDRPVVRSTAKDLPCFENRYRFVTDCIKRYNEAMANITKKEQEGYQVIGFDLPRCDLDGMYAPVQCAIDRCYCVDANGVRMRGTNGQKLEVDRSDPLAANQECTCARHMEKIRVIKPKHRNKVTELFSRYQCDRNGNYIPIQCSDSACYCVNAITGFERSSDDPNDYSRVLKSEPERIKSLFCYIEYVNQTTDADRIRLNELLHIPN